MRKYLVGFAVILMNSAMAMTPIVEYPSETIILKGDEQEWKEVMRSVSKNDSKVYRVPLSENGKDWTQAMAIQSSCRADAFPRGCSVEMLLGNLQYDMKKRYGTVKWNVISQDARHAVYEWGQVLSDGKSLGRHEVVHLILTDSSIQSIGVTERNRGMNPEERAKWIQLLSENVSVIPFEQAGKVEGLSLYEKIKDSIALGEGFKEWSLKNHIENDNGFVFSSYVSPTCATQYVSESLEVCTMPNLKGLSLDELYKVEKQFKKEAAKVNDFKIIERTPTELIYTYSYPSGYLQLNGITRLVRTEYGYYSFTYKLFLKGSMQKSKITFWKDQLKAIEIK